VKVQWKYLDSANKKKREIIQDLMQCTVYIYKIKMIAIDFSFED